MPSKYKSHQPTTERTFVMIKPDGLMRGLVGDIIKRFEQRGLKMVAMKMVEPTREKIDGFYPRNEEWVTRLGHKGLTTFSEYNMDPVESMGTNDPSEIGIKVRATILDFMTMGPVIPMIVEGVHAIAVVRKLVGNSLPVFAEPGTIRGDYSHDAATTANMESRSVFNLVHASETQEEATHEIGYWFTEGEIFDYDRVDHAIMFGDKRHL